MNILDILEKRGLLEQTTSPDLKKILQNPTKFYIGFDPTADSLHLGNLVGIIVLRWFQKCGHIPFALIGGATARIGDPSGKSSERPLLQDEDIKRNVRKISEFFRNLLREHPPSILNNDDWFHEMTVIDFLRKIGKHFRLGPMLSKESVKSRVNSNEGMSFTEFTYQVLQGYDFYYLFNQQNVILQVGGSDQWGNITAGIDLAKKLDQKTLYGVTFPLLVQSDGKKFGKSEKGAVWLSEHKLSAFDFYQYLYRVSDADVIRLMKVLTFMELDEIDSIEKKMKQPGYVPNSAQKRLASEVTRFIHGEENLLTAQKITEKIYSQKSSEPLTKEVLEQIAKDLPPVIFNLDDIVAKKYTELAVETGLCSSKSEATRLIKSGGAYLNNQRINEIDFKISEEDLIDGVFLLLGSGKKKKLLLEVKP
ncbi:MAG: tyrosine--tRNA ligase [Chlamydiota bacterium]|jgi:tyrosyl-tRNA synthetase